MKFNRIQLKNNYFSVAKISISFLLIALSSFIFIKIAPFDPDPHHDGIQLAPVIGLLEGKDIHGELFEQYGPVWVFLLLFL